MIFKEGNGVGCKFKTGGTGIGVVLRTKRIINIGGEST